jgi:KRAB domain-containing zinc finger protein
MSALRLHLSKHTKERPEKCPECNIWIVNLRAHQRTHKTTTLFPCTVCSKQFKWKNDLKMHLKHIHNPNAIQLSCSFKDCTYKTVRPKDLQRHERRIHLKIQDHKCLHCKKKFSEKGNLVIHVKTYHSKNPLPFKCDFCDKSFVNLSRLTSHKWSHSEEKRFPCNVCDMKFKSIMGRKIHLKSKHGVGQIKIDINCYFCDKLYHGYSGLLKHLR